MSLNDSSVSLLQKPKPELVVKALMTKNDDIAKDIRSRKGTQPRLRVSCYSYSCPRGVLCKNRPPVVEFQKGSGLRNPYSHLISCLCNGDEEKLIEMYRSTQHNSRDTIESYFSSTLSYKPREKAMNMYLDIIISLSLPISYVENRIFRSFSRAEENISAKSFRSTLFEVVKLVEISIRNEMNRTKGSVMHDSPTNNDSHFLGIYALYTKPVSVMEMERTV